MLTIDTIPIMCVMDGPVPVSRCAPRCRLRGMIELALRHMPGPPVMCKVMPELILSLLFLTSCDGSLSALLDVVCPLTELGPRVSSHVQEEGSTVKQGSELRID